MLTLQLKLLTGCDQELDAGGSAHDVDQQPNASQEVLEAVQDEEKLPMTQGVEELVLASLQAQSEGLGDRGGKIFRQSQRGQRHKDNAVRETGGSLSGLCGALIIGEAGTGCQRQPRLADATRTCDGDQAYRSISQESLQSGQLLLAARKGCSLRRQIVQRGRRLE